MGIGDMMRQVQEMQAKMVDMQRRLADAEVSGQAGGGMVVATMNGKSELKKIKIDPSLATPAELDVLEDLIVAACAEARAKAEKQIAAETEKMMGGLQLPPGMKLPI